MDEGPLGISYAVCYLLDKHPDKARQARDKPQLRGWFVGQVMKMTDGKYKVYDVATEVAKEIRLVV